MRVEFSFTVALLQVSTVVSVLLRRRIKGQGMCWDTSSFLCRRMKSWSVLLLLSLLLLSPPLARPSSSAPPSLLSLLDSPLALHLLRLLDRRQEEVEARSRDDGGEEGAFRGRRDEPPPISIDLTFHLLRRMMHMDKMESQREQALVNRRIMDEVGK
ncbi:hypothetical protein WMY93_030959 [Mugilogobius chulae]|uniref:Corticotropin-releasing factor domain-containing protein n=1 Tax=Mugilogobius chulae TaxID=88201 RepID=A0AAW0MFM1_9GOBI